MAKNPRKLRPNNIILDLRDEGSHKVLRSSRTRKRHPMLVGYARTSTADQTAGLDAQQRDLKAAGCGKVFAEQTSGISHRPALAECLRFLREGDTLLVTKPDRLARNTAELLKIEHELTERGAGLVIQSMGLDTRNGSNPTARLMLTILAGVATWEREIMLERQREGIAKAKAEGRYKGRPPSIDRARVRELLTRMTPTEAAKTLGVARSSVYRLLPRAAA